MENQIIRPSMKTVWAAYVAAGIVFFAGVAIYLEYGQSDPPWLMAIPLIFFFPAIRMHVRRRLIKLRLHDGHLTIESGFISSTRRTVDVAKIQDVTVSQTFGQRILGVGDLRLESAGEGSAMGVGNLDHPREIADAIIAASKRAHRG